MTRVGSVYGKALYDLAEAEKLSDPILDEMMALAEAFRQEPDFLRLISARSLSKGERCNILDNSFRGKVHKYVLNFMKLLTEKGYARHFDDCCQAYRALYNRDHNILPIRVASAVALTEGQSEKLASKLSAITGKVVALENRVEPGVLGGLRLDWDGHQLDDTLQHRLNTIRNMLNNTEF